MIPGYRNSRALCIFFILALPFYLFTACENKLLSSAELLQKSTILASKSPSGLTGVESNHQVALSWQKVDGATGYRLYWSTNPDTPLASANKISVSGTSYTHTGLSNMTNLYYSVSALGYDAESLVSDPVRVVPHQYMVYVNNGGIGGDSCNTMGFLMDSTDGSLTASEGSPYDNVSYPIKIVVEPSNRFAYIANFNTGQISCYTINPESGALAPIGIPVVAGDGVSALAVHPSGKYLYSVNKHDGNVSALAIDQSSGTLTLIDNYPLGVQPQNLVVDPTGRFLYATLYLTGNGQEVAVFSINNDTGALTKQDSIDADNAVDTGVMGIAIHPNGKFLYLTFWNNATGIVAQAITLNTTTGGFLAGQTTRKYNIPLSLNNAEEIEIDPTGRFLYIAINSTMKIAIYSINQTTGDLTPVSGSPFRLWPEAPIHVPRAIGFDPAGKFAYIVSAEQEDPFTGMLRTYSIDQSSGVLAEAGAPVTLGKNSCDIAVVSLP